MDSDGRGGGTPSVTVADAPEPRRGAFVRDFVAGVLLLGRGLAMYGTDFGLLALGLVPALIAGVLMIDLLVVLLFFLGDLSGAVTWFADGWAPPERDLIHIAAGISLVGIFLLLAVVTFTSVTLAIGDPFYEKISERVDERLGGVPAATPMPWWREILRGIGESIRMVTISALIGIPLFFAGFIPAVGQTVVPVIGALVGGWFLTVELSGVAFARRGMRLAERRRTLRGHRALAVGFGAAVFACFLIPLGAVVVTPAAVAGATMLTRRVLGESTARRTG
jgi:CysZ protein